MVRIIGRLKNSGFQCSQLNDSDLLTSNIAKIRGFLNYILVSLSLRISRAFIWRKEHASWTLLTIAFRLCSPANLREEKAWIAVPAHSAARAVLFSHPVSLKRTRMSATTRCHQRTGSKLKTPSPQWKVWRSTASKERDAALVSSRATGLPR